MDSLSLVDKENADAISKQFKASKQSVLKSISASQDARMKNVARNENFAGMKQGLKQTPINSNIVPIKTRVGSQKYKIQFPSGPMGLILEPVVSSYGSIERHIGGKVKGFRFGDGHSDLFREVVRSSVNIGDIVFSIADREVDWMPFADIMSMLEPLVSQSKVLVFKCLSSDGPVSVTRSSRRRSNRKKISSPEPSTPDASPTKVFRQFIRSDVASPLSVNPLSPTEESYTAATRHRQISDTGDRSFAGQLDDLKCDMASEAADRDAWRSRALMAEEALIDLRKQLLAATTSKNDYCAQLESELTIEQNSMRALVEALETERSERAAEQMELSGELNRMKEEQRDLREDMRAALRNAAAEYKGMEAERDRAVAELEALRDAMSSEKMSLEKERQRMRESLSSVQKGHIDKLIAFENDLSEVKHELATSNGQLERTTTLYHEALSKNRDLQASYDASTEELHRIKSTVARLETELRSLKLELDHARHDIEDKDEDIAHWKAVTDKLRQEIVSHTKRNDSLSQDIAAREKQVHEMQQQLAEANELCAEKDASLSSLQQQHEALESSTAQAIEKNNALMQRIRNRATAHETELLQALSAAEAEHGSQISEYELKMSLLTKELEKSKNSESSLRKELDNERRKFSEILDRQEEQSTSYQEECVKLKKSLAVIQSKFDSASKSLSAATVQGEELSSENNALKEKLSSMTKQCDEEISKVHKLEQVIVRMGDDADAQKKSQAATIAELQTARKQIDHFQKENGELTEELCAYRSANAELSQKVDNYERSLDNVKRQLDSSEHISREKADTIDLLQNELSIVQDQLSTSTKDSARLRNKIIALQKGLVVMDQQRRILASDMNSMREITKQSSDCMRSMMSKAFATVEQLQSALKDQNVQENIIALEREKCSSAIARIGVLDSTIEELRSRIVDLRNELSFASREVATEKETVSDLQHQLQRREEYWKKEWESTEKVHANHIMKLDEDHKEAMNELRLSFEDKLRVKDAECLNLIEKVHDVENRLSGVTSQLIEVTQAREALTTREQTSEIDRVSNLQMIRSLRSRVAELETNYSKQSDELSCIRGRLSATSMELETSLELHKNLQIQYSELQAKYNRDEKSYQQDLRDKNSQIENLELMMQQRDERYTHEVTKLTARMESIDRECDIVVRRIHNEKMELESRYEGRIFELESEITDLKSQMEHHAHVNSKLSRKLQYEKLEYTDKVEALESEIKKMRVQCQDVIEEKVSLEGRVQSLLATIEEISSNEQLYAAEVSQFHDTITDLHATLEERDGRVAELSRSLSESEKTIKSLKLRCSTLQDEVYALEEQQGNESTALTVSISALQNKYDALTDQLLESERKIDGLVKANELLKIDNANSRKLEETTRSAHQEKVKELERTIEVLEDQVRALRDATHSIKEKYAATESQYEEKIKVLQNGVTASKHRVAELSELLDQRDHHCIQLNETTKKLTSEMRVLQSKYDALEKQNGSLSEASNQQVTERRKFESTITRYTEELHTQTQKITVLSRDYASAISRAECAEDSLADLQSQIDILQSKLQTREVSAQQANTEISRLQEENACIKKNLKLENDKLVASNASLQQRCDTLQQHVKSTEAETLTLKEQAQELLELVQQQQQAIDAASAREVEWAQIRSNLISTASERTEKYKHRITEIESAHRQALQQLRKVNDELMAAYETIREKNSCLSEYKQRLDELAEEARRTTSTVSGCGDVSDDLSSLSRMTESTSLGSKCRISCGDKEAWALQEDMRDSIESSVSLTSQASFDLGTCGGLNVKLSQQFNALLAQKSALEESLATAQVQVDTQSKKISNMILEHKNAVDRLSLTIATLKAENEQLKKDLSASNRREDDLRAQLDEIYSSEVLNNIRNCSVLPASPYHSTELKMESTHKHSSSSIVSYIESADTVRTSHDGSHAVLDTSRTSEDDSFFQLSDTDTEHESSLELYDSPDRIMKRAFCS